MTSLHDVPDGNVEKDDPRMQTGDFGSDDWASSSHAPLEAELTSVTVSTPLMDAHPRSLIANTGMSAKSSV